ncbi:MAG TPA: hypothetical protein VF609_06195 [Flavisolibacter sp.]
MKIHFGLLLFGGFLIAGCNPLRRIDMKNTTGDSVQIIWTLNEDSLSNNPFMLSNSKELKFTLQAPKTARINMSFGPGSWTPTEVQKLVNRLQSLEIISASQRIRSTRFRS